MEKKEDAATGLIADLLDLLGGVRLCEEQTCAARAGRSDNEPAFGDGEGRIFDDAEDEGFCKEGQRFLVIANQQCDVSQRLWHDP